MEKEKIIQELKEYAEKHNNKITCAKAWEFADKFGITKKQMGELLNELKIKITSCQLGCF